MRRIKNVVVMSITAVMIGVFFFSIAAIDSESWIPFVLLIVSLMWIVAFAAANGYLEISYGEDEENCTYEK